MQTVKVPGLVSHSSVAMYPTLSVYNSFIPLNAKTNGELLQSEEDKIIYYSGWFSKLANAYRVNNYEAFSQKLIDSKTDDRIDLYEYTYFLTKRGMTITYIASTGMLYYWHNNEIPIVLLAMCVKHDAVFSLNKDAMNPSHLCLVISKSLITEHNALYRNIKRYYIDKVDEEGVDIIYTNSVLQLCYNDRGLKTPHFGTVEEMINYTKSLNTVIHAAIKEELLPEATPRGIVPTGTVDF